MDQTIDKKFKIKKDTLENINNFKKIVGENKFELILYGLDNVQIPFDVDKFDELMDCLLEEKPEEITYSEAGEIAGFFCKPFAGTLMKQAAFTLNGISSLLQKLDQETLKTLTESGIFQQQNGISIDASSLQTVMQKQESDSMKQKTP